MISMRFWKLSLEMPTPRPLSGPAIQPGQPPLRPGTYCVGLVAAPALSRKTLVTTPSSPSAPSTRMAPVPLRAPVAASMLPGAFAALLRPAVGIAACISSLLRLADLQVFDPASSLCLSLLPARGLPFAGAR
jgi:hypothetical protein